MDDLSQILSHHNIQILQEYAQLIFETTTTYFQANHLAINQGKTESLLVKKTNDDGELYLMSEEGEILKSKKTIKILGVKFNERNNLENYISHISMKIGLIHASIKPLLRH